MLVNGAQIPKKCVTKFVEFNLTVEQWIKKHI